MQNTNLNRYLYGGKELQDEQLGGYYAWPLNLYDFEARFYSYSLSRFMQPDPLAEKYYSISPYAYCLNNPLRFVDPDGRQVLEQTQRLEYGDSWAFNALKFVYNSVASITNVGVDLVNGAATDVGYIANNGLAEYGKAVATQVGEGVSNTVGYHINTPIAQQLSDLGSELSSVEYWENFAGGVASIAVAKGAANVVVKGVSTETTATAATKGGGLGNPFKEKTFNQIDGMFKAKGFTTKGIDPLSGKGSYFNSKTGTRYYLDKGGMYKKGFESPHVDVWYNGHPSFEKAKFFLDGSPKMYTPLK